MNPTHRATNRTHRVRALFALGAALTACTDNAGPTVPTPTPACEQIASACAGLDGGSDGAVRECVALAADPASTATACHARAMGCLAACGAAEDAASDADAAGEGDGGGSDAGESDAGDAVAGDADASEDARADAPDADAVDEAAMD